MKHMKKLIALILVAITVMAIAIPAMALTWGQHYGPGILNSGTTGDVRRYIRNVQYDIRSITGYSLTVDGYYGPQTKRAVSCFQYDTNTFLGFDLQVDGIAGPATKQALHQLRPNCSSDHPND